MCQLVCHSIKTGTSSPIDQHALMIVHNARNSVFIRGPFQAPIFGAQFQRSSIRLVAPAHQHAAITLIPMGHRKNSVDAAKSLDVFEKDLSRWLLASVH